MNTGKRKLIHKGRAVRDDKGLISGTCLSGNFMSSGNVEEENFCYQVMDLKKHNLDEYKTLKSGIYLYSIKTGKTKRVIEYPRLADSLATTGDVICFTNDRETANQSDKDTGELFEVYVRRGDEFKPLKLKGLEHCEPYYFRFLGDDRVVAVEEEEIYVIDYKKKTYFRKKVKRNQDYLYYNKRKLVLRERLGNGKVRLSYYK